MLSLLCYRGALALKHVSEQRQWLLLQSHTALAVDEQVCTGAMKNRLEHSWCPMGSAWVLPLMKLDFKLDFSGRTYSVLRILQLTAMVSPI